jgi:CRP-like cAMP-binding protein
LIDVNLSRVELAEMAGLTRETVSLVLSEFASKNWIKTLKRRICIGDRAGLKSLL